MFMDLSKKNHEKKAHTIFLVKKNFYFGWLRVTDACLCECMAKISIDWEIKENLRLLWTLIQDYQDFCNVIWHFWQVFGEFWTTQDWKIGISAWPRKTRFSAKTQESRAFSRPFFDKSVTQADFFNSIRKIMKTQ